MSMSNPKSKSKNDDDNIGSCYTNDDDEDNEDDNAEYDDDDDEEDDDDDDDDKLLSYLFDKAFLKQHAIAILIAVIATAISYFHILTPQSNDVRNVSLPSSANSVSSNPVPVSSPPPPPELVSRTHTRTNPLKETAVHHHHSYRRTNNLFFCPTDFFSPSEPNQQRILRAFESLSMSTPMTKDIDPNLELMQFNFPKDSIDIMKSYYYADDNMDDNYDQIMMNNVNDNKKENEYPSFVCMNEAVLVNERKSSIPMHTIAYRHPDIETYYSNPHLLSKETKKKHERARNQGMSLLEKAALSLPDTDSDGNVISNGNNNGKNKNKMQPADLSYKGFTAKFTNLSPDTIHLYWDSRAKAKIVGTIEPFASITTVTFPGNSFHVTPTYDVEHALQRWTITNDDSTLYYNPYADDYNNHNTNEEAIMKLSKEQRMKYDMHQLNRIYGREYLAVTQRAWLSTFPRPMEMHHMWEASYFGQEHVVKTKQTHFSHNAINTENDSVSYDEKVWQNLDYEDYDNMLEKQENGQDDAFVQLQEYRQSGELELKLEVVSAAPRVFEIQNFLSQHEINHLLHLAKKYNVTSLDQKTNQHKSSLKQRSEKLTKIEKKKRKKALNAAKSNAWIRREISPIVNSIYHRVADALGIDESLLRHRNEHENSELNTHHSIAEALHLVQYVKGQGYSPRQDGSQPSIMNRYQPNRFATIVFFLSDGDIDGNSNSSSDGNSDDTGNLEGGELIFPLAVTAHNHDGITIKPKAGKAVIFYNMLPDGNIDDLSHHSSKHIESGEKWMGTMYVWDPIID